MKKIKYLWVYSADNTEVLNWHNKLIAQRREKGYDVEGFCCTPQYLRDRKWIPFPTLDNMWELGYPPLMKMYEQLMSALEGKDILIHYNGANLHPEFLKMVKQFKVFTAGDDPESTDILSKPVAKYYDLHLINNIACVDMYKSWGLENVFFWPLGSIVFPEELSFSEEDIVDLSLRTNPLVYVGEKNIYKKEFFDYITSHYCDNNFWGKGWDNGYISENDRKKLYCSSQVGFNVHNSIGPINFRFYELPAYGIMQICDNKDNIQPIYDLGSECIGFNRVEECVHNIDYFLSHPMQQREIALNAWLRWQRDYTPIAVWEKMIEYIEKYYTYRNVTNDYVKSSDIFRRKADRYFWKKVVNKVEKIRG